QGGRPGQPALAAIEQVLQVAAQRLFQLAQDDAAAAGRLARDGRVVVEQAVEDGRHEQLVFADVGHAVGNSTRTLPGGPPGSGRYFALASPDRFIVFLEKRTRETNFVN